MTVQVAHNLVKITIEVNITRCDWSLPMIYDRTNTWMTSWESCFFVLLNMAHGFKNVCEIISH